MLKENYHYKWRYADKDRPKGCCYDCRMKYSEFPDLIIPDYLWEEINPTEHADCGLLCPTCIANRLNWISRWYDLKILDTKIKTSIEYYWNDANDRMEKVKK